MEKLLLTFTLTMAACATQAANYYVSPSGSDNNPGTLSSPFWTIHKASTVAAPGDVVFFRGGTYMWTAQQGVSCTGTSALPITFQAYTSEVPVLDGSLLPTGTRLDFIVVGHPYNNFSGLTIQNSPKSDISLWGAQWINLRGCRFLNAYLSGIYIAAQASNINVQNCEVTGCNLINQALNSSQWNPSIFASTSTGVTVSGCLVHGNYGEGIGFCGVSGSVMSGNTVYDNFSVNCYLDNVVSSQVANNLIYSTFDTQFYRSGQPASGIQCAVENITNPLGLYNCTISGNVVVDCRTGFHFGSYGIPNMGMHGLKSTITASMLVLRP